MSRDSLRYFGLRLAIPLLPGTCVDDARMLVDGIHERIEAQDPTDDFWLNLLGTALLRGHTNLVFGAKKLRSHTTTPFAIWLHMGCQTCVCLLLMSKSFRKNKHSRTAWM